MHAACRVAAERRGVISGKRTLHNFDKTKAANDKPLRLGIAREREKEKEGNTLVSSRRESGFQMGRFQVNRTREESLAT